MTPSLSHIGDVRQPMLTADGRTGRKVDHFGLLKKIEGRFEQLPLDGITKYGVEQKVVTATSFATVRPSIQRCLWQTQRARVSSGAVFFDVRPLPFPRIRAAGMTSKVVR